MIDFAKTGRRQRGLDLLRRLVEVAGELDLLVAKGGDLGEGAVEVLGHRVADGIELHAEPLNAVRLREHPGRRGGHREAGAEAAEERTAVQRHCGPFKAVYEVHGVHEVGFRVRRTVHGFLVRRWFLVRVQVQLFSLQLCCDGCEPPNRGDAEPNVEP